MGVRSSLPLMLILVVTLTLVISPSLGVQMSVGISSSGRINYPGETNHLPRLHVEGRYIKDQFGRTVYLKGVNFQTEAWWTSGHGTEEQIIYMKEWGCNVVGLMMTGWAFKDFPEVPLDPDFLNTLDSLVNWAEKHGMYVVLRFISSIWGSDAYKTGFPYAPSTWGSLDWSKWITFWETIAARYRGRTHVLYDIINEPVYIPSPEFYQARIRECIDAIRAVDPEIICIVQAMGEDWSKLGFGFEQTHPIDRPNVVFSGHMYQDDQWAPEYGREELRARMTNRKWDWIINTGRCLWVGEFNTQNRFFGDPALSPELWLRNFLDILNEEGYAGFSAYTWNTPDKQPWALITDWNVTPSVSGSIIREYLG